APPEMEKDIEKRLPNIIAENRVRDIPLEEAVRTGAVEYTDLFPAYAGQIARMVDLEAIRRAGLKVAVDSMFGAGSGYFRRLIGDGATEIIEMHSERNPLFPGLKQPEPTAANLPALCQAVRLSGASIGLATDGDGDRIGVVDETGKVITPLQVFGLLALYLLEIRGQRGAIVKTINTTDMVNKLGEMYGVPVFETKVGFKHVAPIMEAEDALVSGEESGSFAFRGHIPERDGILSGLILLDMMAKTNKKPSEMIDRLYRRVAPHHYHRTDVEFPAPEREAIAGRLAGNIPEHLGGVKATKVNTMDGHHFRMEDGSWLLIRFSGTEPLLRIYAEAATPERAMALIAEAKALLRI
ncbi:MAG: phosphoglucomutase/phosphomannomutase family protein, partial [Chloroflexi bacterium]|nr:phosphoglucomutase/phosphomannomutase family protein [Chloroflexota bacterium]